MTNKSRLSRPLIMSKAKLPHRKFISFVYIESRRAFRQSVEACEPQIKRFIDFMSKALSVSTSPTPPACLCQSVVVVYHRQWHFINKQIRKANTKCDVVYVSGRVSTRCPNETMQRFIVCRMLRLIGLNGENRQKSISS